jgi:iron complex transport system ATP-binding protein
MTLEARSLVFSCGEKKIIDDCSLQIAPGKLTFITGPNGSGKTTLLHLLGGLYTPQGGEVLLNGVPLDHFSHTERACRMGVLTQEKTPGLDFTARERIIMGRFATLPRLFAPGKEDLQAVAQVMETMGITELADAPCNRLSGGEYQKVLIAALLAGEKKIMLLDEPTSAVDPAGALRIMKLFRSLKEKHAIAIVTHDLALAAAFADQMILTSKGKIFDCGTPEQVLTKENIAQVYDCDSEILHSSNGLITVFR